MGNCWCFKSKPRKKIVLLLLGLDNSGKTATVKGLAGESRDALIPTVGFSLVNLKYRKSNVHIYDLGGGPQIRGIWQSYFADAHGIIFVVDSSNYKRLTEARLVLQEVLSNEKLGGKPMLLLANKQDLPGALDELDIVEKLKVEDLVNQQRCPTLVKSCSATEITNSRLKLDDAIYKGYTWLLNLILRDYWKLNARVERDLREQHGKNLIIRQEILNRIQKNQERRRQTNLIEFGSGDTVVSLSPKNDIKSNNWIERNSPTSPTVIVETDPTIPTTSNIEYISSPVPSKDEKNLDVSKETPIIRKVFSARRRSNKTAPATFFSIDTNDNAKNRQLKSATTTQIPLTLNTVQLESEIINHNSNATTLDLFMAKGENNTSKTSLKSPIPLDIFVIENETNTQHFNNIPMRNLGENSKVIAQNSIEGKSLCSDLPKINTIVPKNEIMSNTVNANIENLEPNVS